MANLANLANLPNFPNTRIKFTMKDKDLTPLWSIEGQGPGDREMLTGLLVAIFHCVSRLPDPDQYIEFSFAIDGEGEVYIGYDYDTEQHFEVKDHFEMTDFDDVLVNIGLKTLWFNVLKNGTLYQQAFYRDKEEGLYYWMYEQREDDGGKNYSFMTFRSPHFIRGFIMGCNACGIDFHTMVIGKPCMIDINGNISYYDIQGYEIVNPPGMPTRVTY